MKKLIIPSIIASSQKELNSMINKMKHFTNIIQLDIMDGKFVKNKSINFNFKLSKTKKCKYEAHLMINNPEKWIKKNSRKVDTIIFHIETTKKPEKTIDLIKEKGKKAGIAIKPKTSVKKIQPYLNKVGKVLVMTVNPGRYGAKFLSYTLKKVYLLKKLKQNLNIEVDGGITSKTIKKAKKSGADNFISGSYIQESTNQKKAFNELNKLIL